MTSSGTTHTLLPDQVWQAVLGRLVSHVPCEEYAPWLKPTSLRELEDGSAILVVPNVFVRQEVESRYLNVLASAFREVLGYGVEMQVVIGNDAPG